MERRPLGTPESESTHSGALSGSGYFRFWRRARAGADLLQSSIEKREAVVISLAIGILITIVVGAILFWVIDRFCPDRRLAQLLKLLVVLVCLGSIVSRLLPMLGYPSVL